MSAYRGGFDPGGYAFAFPRLTPVVKWIMIVCGIVQVVQLVTQGALGDWLDLSADRLLSNPLLGIPNLFTYMWVHAYEGLGHLVFNMLALWFFGSLIEEEIGSRGFFRIFLVCGIAGGLLWVVASKIAGFGKIGVVGASGGVYGILAYAAFSYPRMRVILILFPIMLAWLVGGLAVFALYDMIVQLQRGGMGGTAHAAHVGGMVGGVLLYRFRGALAQRDIERETRTVRREKDKAKDDEAELDRILEKIHDEGMSKLTKAERRFLETRSKNKS
ncbi:MAG: rhomboid family intramembrane serine protease [Planctomycetes bacterium]|nr:rhomboid family intramembrane serine protease [Planctomycetota bacterium]MCB9918641.1 rhomboid family intramembrane serine protease [Planctomycetota bacterium]